MLLTCGKEIGNAPAGSLFAALQSTGAIGLTGILLSPTAIVFRSATFASVLYGIQRNPIYASKINGFTTNTSARLWSAQQRFAGYAQQYLANHPDVAEKIHFYRHSAEAHLSPYISFINKQEIMDTISKHSNEAIKVLDENTCVSRKDLIKSTSSLLSSMNSHETAGLIRKHLKEGVDKARIYTENAIHAANSCLATIHTQENVDFIREKSQEALHTLDEHVRIHRDNLMRSTSSFLSNINSQKTADLVCKHSKEGAEKAAVYTKNTIDATNAYLSAINTLENIDLFNKKSQQVLHALNEQTRVHGENIMQYANSYFTGLFPSSKL